MKRKIYKTMESTIKTIGYSLIVYFAIGVCYVFITPFVSWGLENPPKYFIIILIAGWLIKKWHEIPNIEN
jgi:hypothetical protein